jgi:hypothetical protein
MLPPAPVYQQVDKISAEVKKRGEETKIAGTVPVLFDVTVDSQKNALLHSTDT